MLSIVICLLVIPFPILYSRYGPFRYYTRMYFYFLIMTLVGLICMAPCMLHFKSPSNLLLPSSLLRRLSFLIGVTFKVLNSERIRKTQRYIFVANHQTALDIFGMMVNWHLFHPCVPVMKKELLWSGPVGIICWMSGCVFVDRQNSERGRAALNEKLTVVSDGKCSLFMYPEGTRCQEAKMRQFKKGAFFMAIQCKVPILPIVYSQYPNLVNEKKKIFESGAVTMTILPEVSTEGLTATDVPALAERVYDIMQSYIDEETANAQLWGDPFEAEAPEPPATLYCPTPKSDGTGSGCTQRDGAIAGTSAVADGLGSGADKNAAEKTTAGATASQWVAPQAEASTKPKSKVSNCAVPGPASAIRDVKDATEEKGTKPAERDKTLTKAASNPSQELHTSAGAAPGLASSTASATGEVDRRSYGKHPSDTNVASREQSGSHVAASGSSMDNTAKAQKIGSSTGADGGQRT